MRAHKHRIFAMLGLASVYAILSLFHQSLSQSGGWFAWIWKGVMAGTTLLTIEFLMEFFVGTLPKDRTSDPLFQRLRTLGWLICVLGVLICALALLP